MAKSGTDQCRQNSRSQVQIQLETCHAGLDLRRLTLGIILSEFDGEIGETLIIRSLLSIVIPADKRKNQIDLRDQYPTISNREEKKKGQYPINLETVRPVQAFLTNQVRRRTIVNSHSVSAAN